MIPPPPRSTLFPYTTLFRSQPDPLLLREGALFLLELERHVERSEEHTSELQSRGHLVCRLLLEKKKKKNKHPNNTCQHRTRLNHIRLFYAATMIDSLRLCNS